MQANVECAGFSNVDAFGASANKKSDSEPLPRLSWYLIPVLRSDRKCFIHVTPIGERSLYGALSTLAPGINLVAWHEKLISQRQAKCQPRRRGIPIRYVRLIRAN